MQSYMPFKQIPYRKLQVQPCRTVHGIHETVRSSGATYLQLDKKTMENARSCRKKNMCFRRLCMVFIKSYT